MFRGLLSDDPSLRWDQSALDDWVGGKRRPAAQSKIEKRAARGFDVVGTEYLGARELAIAFCANWDAAIVSVTENKLDQWLSRALGADDMADAVARVIDERKGGTIDKRIADDVMLCKICMILDPLAPIRYRTVSVVPQGLGALLALTIANGSDVNNLVRVFRPEILKAWSTSRELSDENRELLSKLRSMSDLMAKSTLGNGIERVLYALNDSIPCQSPTILKSFVIDIGGVIPALDTAAKTADRRVWPIDRHVAAFVGARATFDVARQMQEIADPSAERSALGMLNLLASLQWRLGPKAVPSLAGWVAGLVKPILNGYRSQRRRRDLERDIQEPAAQGDLVALFRMMDDPDARARDRIGYEQAGEAWRRMAHEIEQIDKELSDHDDKAAEAARRVSALISMSLALLTVIGLAALKR
jgi:hypothetical protein